MSEPPPTREQTAKQASSALRKLASKAKSTEVLIGFDGFVDSIIRVVDQRQSVDDYEAMPTIKRFADKIGAADGKSANFEFVTTQEKLGGNGPIMANALLQAGLDVAYVGALGKPAIHPVFTEFATHARAYSVSEPGYTDAVEFDNGKLMFGKYAHMAGLDGACVEREIGRDKLTELVQQAKLIGMTNWTMLPAIESAWELVADLIPEGLMFNQRPIIFVDLADPAKRSDADVKGAMSLLTRMQVKARVVLGMNLAEGTRVREVLGLGGFGDDPGDAKAKAVIGETASKVREALGLFGAVVHPREGAAASLLQADGTVVSGEFLGPFVAKPKLSTGAGDNFNAGFCLGMLAGLPVEGCLCTGTATSGYYVRNAASPTLKQLAAFCDELPSPE